MHERLIITNGDAAASIMRDAGFDAELLPWRDVLHDGPVPQGLALEALSKLRSEFLREEFGAPPPDAEPDFVKRDAVVRAHARYPRIELWFEHDLYDQLQLLQILDFFADSRRDNLLLVQADDYLGTR